MNQIKYLVSDWVEDGLFRNLTIDQVVEKIKASDNKYDIKYNLTNWIDQQKQYNNIDDAIFGEQVLNILIKEHVI